MAISVNTESLSRFVLHRVDFIADTLAELQATPGPYINQFVLIKDTGQIYKVLEDLTVESLKLSLKTDLNNIQDDVRLFIQPTTPVVPAGVKYLWVQTEYTGPGGITVWYEDLQP